MRKNIHIGYGDSAKGCLLEAIQDHGLPGDGAIPSRDDFTQGPISECLGSGGLQQRIAYWESVDKVLGFRFDAKNFYNNSLKILDDLEADEITIWVGDSCHDILATGWLLSYLEHKDFSWFVVNLADVEPKDYPQEMPAVNLAMYTPNQIPKLFEYRNPLSLIDREYFATTWQKACFENSHYRIKKGNEIVSVDEDYFDEYILSNLQLEFEPTTTVIGRILRDGRHRISDTTVEWNIKKLINKNLIEYEGDLKSTKAYSIRSKML